MLLVAIWVLGGVMWVADNIVYKGRWVSPDHAAATRSIAGVVCVIVGLGYLWMARHHYNQLLDGPAQPDPNKY